MLLYGDLTVTPPNYSFRAALDEIICNNNDYNDNNDNNNMIIII